MATTLDESARRAGAHQWMESRLFELLGGWVTAATEPDVRLLLDRHSQHSAWRAAQWWDRLPQLADVDRRSLCSAPSAGVVQALERLAALDDTIARLAGTYRVVLPRMWVAYERHRAAASDTADGSALRTLNIVAADLGADWREGEAVLEGLLTDRQSAARAAEAAGAVESVLVAGN